MAQTKLTILVILSSGIYMTLGANEEAEVIATGDSPDLNLVAERHPDRIADLLSLSRERPSE